jgi:hypothetical protein
MREKTQLREYGSMSSRPTWSTRTRAVAECLKLIVIAPVLVALSVPAFGQDRMVLGPRQFERDQGAGAVLCIWSIYLTIQTDTAACGWPRRPVDDAIDDSIGAIDEFILANSSLHPTRATLDDFKHRAAESHLSFVRRRGRSCESRDVEPFRGSGPDQIRASTKALLAIPREPVMNPCL